MSKGTRLNNIYHNMKQRCYNSKKPDYKYYGARGIKVCTEWLTSYSNFKEWAVTNGYSEGLTIDRIDVNGDYCPANCRWITQKEQCNNMRSNHYITYNGCTKTLSEWAETLGLPYGRLKDRLNKCKMPLEVAFSKQHLRLRMITLEGRTQSLKDWCNELKLKYDTVAMRLHRGWSITKALELKEENNEAWYENW